MMVEFGRLEIQIVEIWKEVRIFPCRPLNRLPLTFFNKGSSATVHQLKMVTPRSVIDL